MLNKIMIVFLIIAILLTLFGINLLMDDVDKLEKENELLKIYLKDLKIEHDNTRYGHEINNDLLYQLVDQLDKKVEFNPYDSGKSDYLVVDFTETEKTAKKLRQQADELEAEEE